MTPGFNPYRPAEQIGLGIEIALWALAAIGLITLRGARWLVLGTAASGRGGR
jgi:hypothetical protein